MSLYEDSQLMAQLSSALDSADEMDADYKQTLADTLEATEASFNETAEAICKLISNEDGYIAGAKVERTRLDNAIKRSQRRIESLKNYLQTCLDQAGLKKAEAGTYKISIAKNGGKLPLVIDNEEDLPFQFRKVTTSPDTEAIRKFLDEGHDSPFFHYAERGESIRIK